MNEPNPDASARADTFLSSIMSLVPDESAALEPLRLLPPEQRRVAAYESSHFAVAVFSRAGSLFWMRWSILAFPNDLIGIEDLERQGVLPIYMAAIK
jgi:hypothetical protein